jgi:uncharacterized tellurite resistance protein B-like protein
MNTNYLNTTHSIYHQGLLYFAHLLLSVDGVVDEREVKALEEIRQEENIPDDTLLHFRETIATKTNKELYQNGIDLLNSCTEQERLCALVHLYRLTESDLSIHPREVRLLLYALKRTDVDFSEIELTARLARARKSVPH